MNIELLKYIPIVGEKHFAVVLIRLEKRYLVSYKVAVREDGGLWISTSSTKVGSSNGKDHYMEAFRSDSSYENEEIRNFIANEIERIQSQGAPSRSVFNNNSSQRSQNFQANAIPQPQNGYQERQMPQNQPHQQSMNFNQNQSNESRNNNDYFV